jgi:hypothetical protein
MSSYEHVLIRSSHKIAPDMILKIQQNLYVIIQNSVRIYFVQYLMCNISNTVIVSFNKKLLIVKKRPGQATYISDE